MKRFLLVGALALAAGEQAFAADLPPAPAPPPRAPAIYVPALPVYNWTGFYIGGNLGGAFNNGSFSDPSGNTFSATNSFKFIGGAQVGANYEFSNGALVGVEADFDFLPNTGNTSNTVALVGPGAGNTASITVNNQWVTTVTGRLGYAWDRVLLYGKGGGAWVGASNPALTINGAPQAISTSSSNWGWTGGVGLEWAFWNNWSARVEYDYIGLTSQTFTIPASATVLPGDSFSGHNRYLQMVTAGINYKFGW